MRRLLVGSLLVAFVGCFPSLTRADGDSVTVGVIQDISVYPDPSIDSFYVTNLTAAGLDPGIMTDVNFTYLSFSALDSMGNSSGPSSPIPDIPSAGGSADVFDTTATDLVSGTLTGVFDVTSVTLSDGTQVTINPNFTATILPSGSCGDFLATYCDVASIDAEIIPATPTPEPGTFLLISCGLPLLAFLRRRKRIAKLMF